MEKSQKELVSISLSQTLKEVDTIEFETGNLLKVFESFDKINTYMILSKVQQEVLTNLVDKEIDVLLNFTSSLKANLTLNGVTTESLSSLYDGQKSMLSSSLLGTTFKSLTTYDTSLDVLKTLIFIIKLNLKSLLIEYSQLLEKYKGKSHG